MIRPKLPPVVLAALLLLAGCAVASPRAEASDRKLPHAGDAASYPAVDVHPEEHVAIAADPYNTKGKESIFRIDYTRYGFLPIRVIITNNGDTPISLAGAHMNFLTAYGDKVPPAKPADVERRTNEARNPEDGYKLGPLHIGGKSVNRSKAIEADFSEFGFAALAVEPHTTRSGFLFFDLQGLDRPLSGGRLNVDTIRNAAGKELFYFDIPFNKYLAAQPANPGMD